MSAASPTPSPSVCAGANTRYPITRAERRAWIEGEIRARHAALWGLLPGLSDPPSARYPAVWEDAAQQCLQLWTLAAELSGLEAKS